MQYLSWIPPDLLDLPDIERVKDFLGNLKIGNHYYNSTTSGNGWKNLTKSAAMQVSSWRESKTRTVSS